MPTKSIRRALALLLEAERLACQLQREVSDFALSPLDLRVAGCTSAGLRWMLEKAEQAGLAVDAGVVKSFPYKANVLGALHNSKTGLYVFTRGFDRPIGLMAKAPGKADQSADAPDPTQDLHDSVRKRWDGDPAYRPPRLLEYFERIKDPRGERIKR